MGTHPIFESDFDCLTEEEKREVRFRLSNSLAKAMLSRAIGRGATISVRRANAESWINSPAGPKTVFFWAPAWKWCLVFATLSDYFRPADKLSLNLSMALTATGFIWSRYSMVIIPKNYVLFSVNICLGLTGLLQCARILNYQQSDEYKAKQLQS